MRFRIFYLLIVLIVYYVPILDFESQRFYLLTSLMFIFHFVELRKVYRTRRPYFFVSPIFLAVIVVFGLVFGGIVNFLLLGDDGYNIKGFGYKVWHEKEWLSKTMYVACIASLATWIGYDTRIGTFLYSKYANIPIFKTIFKSSVSENRLILIAVLAYLIKFYLFSIGLYGRIVSEEYFESGVGFKEGSQIRVLGELSYITFFFISILKFNKPSRRWNALFGISLLLELFFGFIYGARSAFIAPLLIVFIAFYYVRQKVSLVSVLLIGVSVYMAFTIVLEYKTFVLSKDFSRSSNSLELISNFEERQNRFVDNSSTRYQLKSAFYATMESVTFVPETAVAIRQKDSLGMKSLSNPNIISTILKFPFDAFVPRFIQGENEFLWGYWYKEEVLELNLGLKYSIAMSPIGFLYMGGGVMLVFIGFFVFGCLLNFNYQFLLNKNLFSALTFMMLLSTFYNIDSVFSNSLIYATRYTFIYPIIFWILFDTKSLKKLKGES